MEETTLVYSAPGTNEEFVELYGSFIRMVIVRFDWGGIRSHCSSQFDDIFQELLMSWVGGSYLEVYDSRERFYNKRTGEEVRSSFRNFLFQFVVQRLLSWRDKLNRQVFHIKTIAVQSDLGEGICPPVIIDDVRYIYRRKFVRLLSMDDPVGNEDYGNITRGDCIGDGRQTPYEQVAAFYDFRKRCEDVIVELSKHVVISKRDYAMLFKRMVYHTWRGKDDKVLQAVLAADFGVSTSTISLMLGFLKDMPVMRNFRDRLMEDACVR